MERDTPRAKDHPLYRTWSSMRNRCLNQNNKDYAIYGGRGIRVCERWQSFHLFAEDVGEKPSPQHTLDRYPNKDGDYEPGNVRWATPTQQARNTRQNNNMTCAGVTRCLSEWAEHLGIDPVSVRSRLRKHPPELALRKDFKPSAGNRSARSARSSTGYKGVYPASANRFQVRIKIDGKVAYLGCFKTKEEGALAYDAAAVEHFGEFARTNFPAETPA